MKAKKIVLTKEERSRLIAYRDNIFYCHAVRPCADGGFTVGFYAPDGMPLWATAIKKIQYEYQVADAVVSLGNEMVGNSHKIYLRGAR